MYVMLAVVKSHSHLNDDEIEQITRYRSVYKKYSWIKVFESIERRSANTRHKEKELRFFLI